MTHPEPEGDAQAPHHESQLVPPPQRPTTPVLTPTTDNQPNTSPSGGPSKLVGVAALVLGVLAFLTGLIPGLGLLLAVSAIVMSIIGFRRKQPLGLTITGIILGGIALLAGIIATLSFIAFLSSGASTSVNSAPSPAATRTASPLSSPDASETATPEETQPSPEQAAPPAPDGSIGSPLPQPYVARGLIGGEKYSLTGRVVDANAGALVNEWNQFNEPAPAGFKYVVAELTMTGIDPDGVEPSIAAFDLYLATAEGNRYDGEFVVFGDNMPSMTDGPTLYPGSSFTGYAAYVVPDTAQSFLLYDNGNYISVST